MHAYSTYMTADLHTVRTYLVDSSMQAYERHLNIFIGTPDFQSTENFSRHFCRIAVALVELCSAIHFHSRAVGEPFPINV